ncbi:hypothetical protein K438DRAFT_1153571 [Mycena galopus ATCC 62051]|nr:hypothetical protein K438DRAFT_1153571 [Mycena galopus ATCC 62051]
MAAVLVFLLDQLDMVENIKKDRFPLEAWHKPALLELRTIEESGRRGAQVYRATTLLFLSLRSVKLEWPDLDGTWSLRSPKRKACSPTDSLLNLTRAPGRRRPAAPEAFAVLTNARLVSSTPSATGPVPLRAELLRDPDAVRLRATVSAYQNSYSSVVARHPDGVLGILAIRACAPAAYAAPMRRPPSSSWHGPNPVNRRAMDNDAPPRRFVPSPPQRHACNPSASRCQASTRLCGPERHYGWRQ